MLSQASISTGAMRKQPMPILHHRIPEMVTMLTVWSDPFR